MACDGGALSEALFLPAAIISSGDDDVCRASLRQIDLIKCDVRQIGAQSRLRADTVLMNPPFGTRRKGADMEFLEAAFNLSTNAIYSLNKVRETHG